MQNQSSSITGFTLVELMITIAVIGVIAFLGVPSLTSLLENNRVTTQTNQLVSSIHLARSEAVKRNGAVKLCPLGEGAICGQDWRKGWMVVAGSEVLQVVDVADQLMSISSAPSQLVFDGEGMVKKSEAEDAAAPSEKERRIIIQKASFRRSVALTLAGSVSSCRADKDGDCVDKK